MKRVLIFTVVALSAVASAQTRTVELTLHPSKAAAPVQEYRLIPEVDKLTEADAVPLYEEAARTLPGGSQTDQNIREWLRTPMDQLPLEQMRSTLEQFGPTLALVEQAVKCRQCKWPAFNPNAYAPNLTEYRRVVNALALQARLQIAQGQYDKAVGTIGTGLAMARQLAEAPNLTQGLVAMSIGVLMCRELEQFVQMPDSPNLYESLKALPQPLVDLTGTMKIEIANLDNYNFLIRRQFRKILIPAHEKVRMTMSKLDRHVAALRCVEAMRLYAGAHEGKFPDKLTDITELDIPVDPVNKKPFTYDRRGAQAFLEAAAPKGATARDAMQYLLNLKE